MKHHLVYSYIFLGVICLLITMATWYAIAAVGPIHILLFSLLLIVLSAMVSGVRFTLITAFITFFNGVYYLLTHDDYLTQDNVLYLVEISFIGLLVGFLIEKYKKTDIVNRFKDKEAAYKEKINNLEEERVSMEREIKVRDEFLSIASHELKTPLTSMLLKVQYMLHSIRNVSLAKFSVSNLLKSLETAEQQSRRLSRMINDLLNVSLITTGKFNLEKENTNLTVLIKELAQEFNEKLEQDGIALEVKADEEIYATVDKLRIEQAITNLLSNAVKYGNQNPIELRIEKTDHIAKITVKDHGIGIKKNQVQRLFMLFERGVTENEYKGLGVGLYITSQIIKAHGGEIKVKSIPGNGSTFTIILPLEG